MIIWGRNSPAQVNTQVNTPLLPLMFTPPPLWSGLPHSHTMVTQGTFDFPVWPPTATTCFHYMTFSPSRPMYIAWWHLNSTNDKMKCQGSWMLSEVLQCDGIWGFDVWLIKLDLISAHLHGSYEVINAINWLTCWQFSCF